MNKNDLRYTKTEELIQTAFFTLIEEIGFDKVTVSQLCERARISRYTFYTHYDDKYQLKSSLLLRLEERLNKSLTPQILFQGLQGNFFISAERVIQDIFQNRLLLRIMMKCDREAVTSMIARSYMDIPTAINISDYEAKVQNRADIRLTRAYLLNALIGFIEEAVELKTELSQEELSMQLYTLCNQIGIFFMQQLQ